MTQSFSRLHHAYLTHISSWLQILKERNQHVERSEHHRLRHLRRRRRALILGDEDKEEEKEKVKKIKILSGHLNQHVAKTKDFYAQADDLGHPLFIQRMAKQYRLNRTEQDVLLITVASAALGEDLCSFGTSPYEILRILFGFDNVKIARNRKLFYAQARLRRYGLLQVEARYTTLADGCVEITERMVRDFLEESTEDDPDLLALDQEDQNPFSAPSNLLNIKSSNIKLQDVHLSQHIHDDIHAIVTQYHNNNLFSDWGLDKKIPYGRGLSLLFYGPPGTGKTMTAHAIANAIGQPLGIVDYSQVMNKFVGESEKYIRRIFADAKAKKCVLLFDECDSLLHARTNALTPVGRMENNLVNLLLQELEAFEGIVILTTNRQDVLDPALERRLALRVLFSLPDVQIRKKLWRSFFTKKMPLSKDVDFDYLAKKYPLPGGDIKNVVLKAVRKSLTDDSKKPLITLEQLKNAARSETQTRLHHTQNTTIGF